MVKQIMEHSPSLSTLFYTLLAFLIPYVTYKVNLAISKRSVLPRKVEDCQKSSQTESQNTSQNESQQTSQNKSQQTN